MRVDLNLVGQNILTDRIIEGISRSNKVKAAGEARQVLNDLFDRNIVRQGVYEREMTRVAEALGLNLKES